MFRNNHISHDLLFLLLKNNPMSVIIKEKSRANFLIKFCAKKIGKNIAQHRTCCVVIESFKIEFENNNQSYVRYFFKISLNGSDYHWQVRRFVLGKNCQIETTQLLKTHSNCALSIESESSVARRTHTEEQMHFLPNGCSNKN